MRGGRGPEGGYRPRRRPLAWVMRLVNEIYDARYARDTSDINEEEEDLSGIEDLEDLEAQRSRLIGGTNDMPKPPLKKPGSTAMNQSKLKKASSSWE